MEFAGTGRTVTLQMLLAAKILEPGKSKMTIEYLVKILFHFPPNSPNAIGFLIIHGKMCFCIKQFRVKNLLAIYCRMVKLNHKKLKRYSVRRVHGRCIVNVLSIRIRSPAVAGHRLSTKAKSWTRTRQII